MKLKGLYIGLIVLAVLITGSTVAHAALVQYNLTAAGSSATINGALFTTNLTQPTGSGVIDSFVRISANTSVEQGFNTSGRPLQFNENNSPTFTHDLLLSDVPVVNIGGTDYRQFLLDINQTGSHPLLSLDQLKIFTSTTGGNLASGTKPNYDISTLGTLAYNLDAGANDNYILLNYNLNSGSGSGDMFAYIPNSDFTNGSFVYLWSRFGDHNANNDGYEEWAHFQPAPPTTKVPEPNTLLLLGGGLLGLGFFGRKKIKK